MDDELDDDLLNSRRLAQDRNAESASDDLPAFLARPENAPVYHGFAILDAVEIAGFRLGMITDFEDDPESGDAFVVSPDGVRAGLVWHVGDDGRFEEVCPIEQDRCGVWGVAIPEPMLSVEAARRNLAAILPQLKEKFAIWHDKFA